MYEQRHRLEAVGSCWSGQGCPGRSLGKEAGLYSEGSEYHVRSLNTFRGGRRRRAAEGCKWLSLSVHG